MNACFILNPTLTLLGQGPVVALIVNLLKRIPWVAARPQAASAVLNALAAILAGTLFCNVDLGSILAAWVSGFAGSTATYEVLLKPLAGSQGGHADTDSGTDDSVDAGRTQLR